MGKKKQPTFRVVAADSRAPRDGRFLELLGTYAPRGESQHASEAVVRIGNDKAGDINTITTDASDAVDDMAGNRTEAAVPVSVLTYLARSMADDPDSVVVEAERQRDLLRLRLHVAAGDMGRVIGRRGRTAQAIRTLVAVAGAREGIQTNVDIVDH